MKNKSLKYALITVLFAPLLVAICILLAMNTERPTTGSLNKITVTDSRGASYSFSDSESLNFYLKLCNNSQKTDKVLRTLDEYYTVEFSEPSNVYSYKFYPVKDSSDCIFEDTEGNYYIIRDADAQTLLLREEMASVYENDLLPEAIFTVEDKESAIYSESFTWKYLKIDNNFYDGKAISGTAPSRINIKADDEYSIKFSTEPDLVETTAFTESGEKVYEGKLDGLMTGISSFSNDTKLRLEVCATWFESSASYNGRAIYNVDILYDVPATFKFVDNTISQGEFTIIEFKNANDDENVVIESDLLLPDVKLYDCDGYKFVFMPINTENDAGTYDITVKTNDSERTVKYAIRDKKLGSRNETTLHENCNDAAKAEYDEAINAVIENSEAVRLWDDTDDNYKFANPVPEGKVSSLAFGTLIYEMTLSSPYRTTGIDIIAEAGTDVVATATGKVAFAGSLDFSGNTVIIDHGFGVISCYENLDSIECEQGQSITKGDKLGTLGSTGYATSPKLHFSVAIGHTFVNPLSNYNYGIRLS